MTVSTVTCLQDYQDYKQERTAVNVKVLAINMQTIDGMNALSAKESSGVPHYQENLRFLRYTKAYLLPSLRSKPTQIVQDATELATNSKRSSMTGEYASTVSESIILLLHTLREPT